jgi:hypothetical protein
MGEISAVSPLIHVLARTLSFFYAEISFAGPVELRMI